jgi:hypothetical protein
MGTFNTTVQPWSVTKEGIYGGDDNYQQIIAGIGHYDGNDGFRLTGFCSKENALLISKAPEMLDMLEKLVNEIKSDYKSDNHLLEEARQLIKEATEL